MKLSSDIQVRAVMPSPIIFIYALNKISFFSKKKWNSQIFQLSGRDTWCVADCSPFYWEARRAHSRKPYKCELNLTKYYCHVIHVRGQAMSNESGNSMLTGQSHAVTRSDSLKKHGIRKAAIQASPRPLTSTFYFVFLNFWLCFFILWEFCKGYFCSLFVVAALFSNLLFICLFVFWHEVSLCNEAGTEFTV